jgi:hypothetical protein
LNGLNGHRKYFGLNRNAVSAGGKIAQQSKNAAPEIKIEFTRNAFFALARLCRPR